VVQHRPTREWIEQNGKPLWLQFPGFPTTGNVELDDELHLAQQLIEYMMAEVLKLGETYREFEALLSQLPIQEEGGAEFNSPPEEVANELPRREFVRAAHDFWPNTFARTFVCYFKCCQQELWKEIRLLLILLRRSKLVLSVRHRQNKIGLLLSRSSSSSLIFQHGRKDTSSMPSGSVAG
jgi:hypothetical protein